MRKLYQAIKDEEIERIKENLVDEGYTILEQPSVDAVSVDILARKHDHIVAYQILVRSLNHESLAHIAQIRACAQELGYDFRVAFVNPPYEKTIAVEGLDRALLEYLSRFPARHFGDVSGIISIDAIGGIQVNSLVAQPDNMLVTGSAIVDATMEVPQHEGTQPATYLIDAPLYFTVHLSHGLKIQDEGTSIRIDTTEYLPTPASGLLECAGTWEGDDLDDCLDDVYATGQQMESMPPRI